MNNLYDNTVAPQTLLEQPTKTLGQYYPWIVILFCSFFLVYKYVLQVSPSVMTNELMQAFQVHGGGLGNLAAMFFYAYLITQFCVGPLLDRYSPRYLTTFAILICGIGTLCFAETKSLLTAELSRALIGAGAAFATVSYMKMSALWFSRKYMTFVDGLLATSAMLGAVCGQIPLTLLVGAAGWRQSLMYCGLAGVCLAILFFLFVKDKNPFSDSQTHSIEKMAPLKWKDFLSLLKSKKNWLLTFYSGLAFTPIAVLGGLWGNPFFVEAHHLSATQAASFSSCIFLGLAFGGPLFGFLGGVWNDRIQVMMLGTLLSLLTLCAAIYLIHLPLLIFGTCLFLFGLGAGAFMLSYPLGKELNYFGFAATVIALINTGDALFGSFTEPLVGKCLDLFWDGRIEHGVHYFAVSNYQLALTLLPLYLVAALFCLGWLKKLNK